MFYKFVPIGVVFQVSVMCMDAGEFTLRVSVDFDYFFFASVLFFVCVLRNVD